jgi:hypothetical protein
MYLWFVLKPHSSSGGVDLYEIRNLLCLHSHFFPGKNARQIFFLTSYFGHNANQVSALKTPELDISKDGPE